MKRLILCLPLLCVELASAQSAVPNSISYQGRVSDANGVLIGDGSPVNRKVTLRIYDNAGSATPLYSEEQTVTISKGVFSVLAGTGLQVGGEPKPPIADVFNGQERFLGVTVDDGTAAADPEITPRQQVASTAFAFRAKTAEVATSVNQPSGTSNMNWLNVNNFTVNGHSKITGQNVLELGTGVAKGPSNGMIGYQAFSSGLDIVGAGSGLEDRRVTIHAQGGTDFMGPVNFGNRVGQHINLWANTFGIGIQNATFYQRTDGHFAWYKGGSHRDGELDGGGGANLAVLNTNGLTVNTGSVRINGGGRFNGPLGLDGHGVFAGSFGDGHSFGSQDWTTFSRSARNFAWYLGGAFSGGELNPNGGTTLAVMDAGGLRLRGAGGDSTSLELGYGVGGKDGAAGVIGYKKYSDALDIVGAGNSGSDRKVKIWAEGGTELTGRIYCPNGGFDVNGHSTINGGTLSVYGYYNRSYSYAYYARGSNGGTLTGQGGGNYPVSIWASDRVVGSEFNAWSDARTKLVEGRSDGAKDLGTLMGLEIADYTMKDKMSAGDRKYKKVVAQQVEKVFPQAVLKTEGTVPDIFCMGKVKDGVIEIKDVKSFQLKQGDTVRLLQKGKETVTEVTKVTGDGFLVKDKVEGDLFVYGRKVNDLRTVDYEALAMLNVSATQEIYRTVEQQAAELKILQNEKDALEKELAERHAEDKLQDTRLAAIEKALKLEAPATAPSKKDTAKTASLRR